MSKVLIADDERTICEAFARMIEKEGHQSLVASNGKQALEIIRREQPDAVFMDIRMPGIDGIQAIRQLQQLGLRVPVVLMTAYGTMDTALEAVRGGAFDYLGKPVELDRARRLLKQMLALSNAAPIRHDDRDQPTPADANPLIGQSAVMQELFKLMGLLTSNDLTALITGESGVGKELVARGIHQHSPRREQPFIAINCAAIPENLLESELFGHEKGAFTGADDRRIGRFESAARGTLFLDEIGELPLTLQSKLLRVLQEHSFERIGSSHSIPLQARLIAATNRNLEQEVETRRFREDLYHRLNVIALCVPPLRQRREDIELLARHFLRLACRDLGKAAIDIDADAMQRLTDYAWPGNVRELEHVMKRSALMARGERLGEHDLAIAPAQRQAGAAAAADDALSDLGDAVQRALQQVAGQADPPAHVYRHIVAFTEQRLVAEALRLHNGNQVSAARYLGLHRTTLRNKMP